MQRLALVYVVLLVLAPASVLGQTVQVDKLIAPGTSGSAILSALGLGPYKMPVSDEAMIPTTVARLEGSAGQIIATPILSSIIPGQKMIIQVDSDQVSKSGGLEKIEIQSSYSRNNIHALNEWLVVEVNSKVSKSAGLESLSDNFLLFVDLKYPYEEASQGFNWGVPESFAQPPTMTFVVPKQIDNVIVDSQGCPVTGVFLLDPKSGQWTDSTIKVLSTAPVSDDKCEVVFQAQHFSKFAVGGIRPSSAAEGPKVNALTFYNPKSDEGQMGFGARLELDPNNPLTNTIDVGEDSSLRIRVSDDAGPDAINHIAIYTNLNGEKREIADSDTYILYNNQSQLRIVDPHGFFTSVDAKTSRLARIVQLQLDFTFAKPMPKSDIIVRVGDSENFNDYRYHNIIEAVEPNKELSHIKMPSWVKNNAKWWSEGRISDMDFVNGLEYLIRNKIITVDADALDESSGQIPVWFKNNAHWWAEDLITETDFLGGIQWMMANKIILL